MNNKNHDRFLAEQIEYYRARANEYDEWFFRQGRYDHGLELNKSWFGEIETLRRAVRQLQTVRRDSRTGLRHGDLDAIFSAICR
jgi:hypothetical protein